jgi:hypothetical protein
MLTPDESWAAYCYHEEISLPRYRCQLSRS